MGLEISVADIQGGRTAVGHLRKDRGAGAASACVPGDVSRAADHAGVGVGF